MNFIEAEVDLALSRATARTPAPHQDSVSLEGVTAYPLTFDRPICATDPLGVEAEARSAR